LWNDRICLALYPDRIVLVRLHGRTGALLESQILPCIATPEDEKTDAAMLRTLAQLAVDLRAKGRAKVSVVLSSHWVEYALVAWDDLIVSEAEANAHAGQFFTPNQWVFRYSECGHAGKKLVSVVEVDLLQALRTILHGRGLQLESVQPYLMTVFNHCQAQLKQVDGWFVLLESGRASMLYLQQGGWQHLRSVRISPDWQDCLPLLLQREAALLSEDIQGGKVFVFEPHCMNKKWPEQGDWRYQSVLLASAKLHRLDLSAEYLVAAMGA